MKENAIIVKGLTLTDDYTIECNLEYPKSLKKYFVSDTFTAKYDKNISAVPESILYIPLLANLAPAAWAIGADIKVPEIDETFLVALNEIKIALQTMYPEVPFSGDVIANRITETATPIKRKASAVLFSGGVDSLTSYILNKDEDIYLVTVWGADVKLHQHEAWALVKRDNEHFGKKYNRENLFIKANIRDFLSETSLNREFDKEIGGWWGKVQHGLGFLGLCAPLSFSQGISTVYIPATHTEQFSEPWGSHPSIDNQVKWSNTTAIHHGYSLSRQQKIRVIADYANREDPTLQIRACYTSTTGDNCSVCEKCSRTMVGLLVEGADPNKHGFSLTSNTLVGVQEKLNRGDWHLAENEAFMWNDIKKNYIQRKENIPNEYGFFFEWLVNNNLEEFVHKSETNNLHRLKKLAHRLPTPVVSSMKKFKVQSDTLLRGMLKQ